MLKKKEGKPHSAEWDEEGKKGLRKLQNKILKMFIQIWA